MSLYNFYRSKEWERLLAVLKIDRAVDGQIICEHCGKPIIKAYDCIGHHKTPLTEENYTDAEIALNPDNIALVHHRCHNLIHNKLAHTQRQVFLVWGAPLSGKTSYVKDAAVEGDLIVDIDSIWECVSGCERYEKPQRLKSVVFAVRDTLIDCVRYRRGKWQNAYIIGGYPYKSERERLATELGAREIMIEATKEECRGRLKENEKRDQKEWEKYIENWFNQFEGKF